MLLPYSLRKSPVTTGNVVLAVHTERTGRLGTLGKMEIWGKIGRAGKSKSGGGIWSCGDDEKRVKDEKRGTEVE